MFCLFQFTKATEETPQSIYRKEYVPFPGHRPDQVSRWYGKRRVEVRRGAAGLGAPHSGLGSGDTTSFEAKFPLGDTGAVSWAPSPTWGPQRAFTFIYNLPTLKLAAFPPALYPSAFLYHFPIPPQFPNRR